MFDTAKRYSTTKDEEEAIIFGEQEVMIAPRFLAIQRTKWGLLEQSFNGFLKTDNKCAASTKHHCNSIRFFRGLYLKTWKNTKDENLRNKKFAQSATYTNF